MDTIRGLAHYLVAKPMVYDAVQRMVGRDYISSQLRPHLAETANSSLIDIGAGTGLYVDALPEGVKYIWLDNDPEKLRGFQMRSASLPAMLGDASRLALGDKSVDYALCIFMAHHLTDEQFAHMRRELSRVVRKKLFLLDPLDTNAWQSSLLWSLDRGSYPRTAEQLTALVNGEFEIERSDTFAVHHRYLILAGRPRR